MTAAAYDLLIEQGATWQVPLLTWSDPFNTPINLTGYTIRLQIRPTVDSATILFVADSSAPVAGITFGALNATGVINITATAAITAALVFAYAYYDLLAVSPAGYVTRLIQGRVALSTGVTR